MSRRLVSRIFIRLIVKLKFLGNKVPLEIGRKTAFRYQSVRAPGNLIPGETQNFPSRAAGSRERSMSPRFRTNGFAMNCSYRSEVPSPGENFRIAL